MRREFGYPSLAKTVSTEMTPFERPMDQGKPPTLGGIVHGLNGLTDVGQLPVPSVRVPVLKTSPAAEM